MRPMRLELEGFASFRERTEVDFGGADLFVLSGPTGSGKSSLIDAITFALYGSVPRYDDRRLVAPVISQGQQQARVRLTFEAVGADYTATRVVRRTKVGATTKEARLERHVAGREPVVLAGTADELSAEVTRLLGLTFDHFTKTVVLPQGDVQEFLHARPKDRQDLLVRLLDLDVYRRVAAVARERAKAAAGTAQVLEDRLGSELAHATEEAVAEAKAALHRAEELEAEVAAARPRLEAMIELGRQARRRAQDAIARVDALAGLVRPPDVDALAARVAAAAAALAEAEQHAERARAALDAAQQARAALPERAAATAVLELHTQTLATASDLARARERAAAARAADKRARADAAEAEEAADDAHEQLRHLERLHLAADLASTLSPGDDCPVCQGRIVAPLHPSLPADLGAARTRAADATAAARAAVSTREQAAGALVRQESAVTHLAEADGDLRKRLAEAVAAMLEAVAPDAGAGALAAMPSSSASGAAGDGAVAAADRARVATDAVLARIDAADRALDDAGVAERHARDALAAGRRRRDDLAAAVDAAWEAFDRARDTVAALQPPAADRTDLDTAWTVLLAWAATARPDAEAARDEAQRAITEAEATYAEEVARLRQRVEAGGVAVDARGVADLERAVLRAVEQARHRHERAVHDLQAARRDRQRLTELQQEARVAKALGRHLEARNFEQWLLNRALKRLVVGASGLLRELSGGAYSLDVTADGAFEVIDHRNADERRPARTLSGGETFLASLTLALSLAEHVAELAAHGSARLDALFLDEGFGTLDAETLDTVSAAIEELGARGRMVGLVTHVRELAERLPVRYEVLRTPTTSTVERVDADGLGDAA